MMVVYQWYLLQAFPQSPGGGPDCAALQQRNLGRKLLLLLLSHCWHRPHRHDGSFQPRNSIQRQLANLQLSNGPDQRTISARKSNVHCKHLTLSKVQEWQLSAGDLRVAISSPIQANKYRVWIGS